jgi:hypothetical protein
VKAPSGTAKIFDEKPNVKITAKVNLILFIYYSFLE